MKKITLISVIVFVSMASYGQGNDLDKGQVNYIPSKENLKNREWFQDAHFGMFIHFGVSSVLGEEIGWALSGKDVNEYKQNIHRFNPAKFDAASVVKLAKDAGMKYITFTTRHHDSFSMFKTKYSDWSIMNTPYHEDVLKMLADECHKQGIRLFCYYSLADFCRADYCQGNVKKGTGIKGECNWEEYLQFMKNQLTEILTNYGPIHGIWFDGHWDQVNTLPGNRTGNQKRAWKYDEIYKLIHDLQPGCMIVNNHHLAPFPGEDFQTFERDLPGDNSGAGFSADARVSEALPLEMSDIIGKSWGYATDDTINRSTKELIHLLVKAAGLGSNLLLNIGPTAEGEVRPAHRQRLIEMGIWMQKYGSTIYGTRKSWMKPADWGVAVEKENKIYLHILYPDKLKNQLTLKNFPGKINSASWFGTEKPVKFNPGKASGEIILKLPELNPDEIDQVIMLNIPEK
ncbi:MAG: alpha-L-fucosidase [Bacteroidales bacterium]|nr:alpha-L-fucosidase [Bacteroidales bacterium]